MSNFKPIRNKIGYTLNDWIAPNYSYRCDPFTDKHDPDKLHVVFAGCSVTAGEAMGPEKTWAYKVHQRIGNTTGYFNIGVSAFSITDIVDQAFKYFYNFGNPDVLFILFPNGGRDHEYVSDRPDNSTLNLAVWRSYFYLEQYCRSNNIKLYSFTWEMPLDSTMKTLLPNSNDKFYYPGTTEERPHWLTQGGGTYNMLKSFDTFHTYTSDELIKSVYYYDTKVNYSDPLSMVAEDGVHQGESFHDFYADFIYGVYKDAS